MLRKMDDVKVMVAMSGGVDSSVAAALLKEQGYQVSGVTMKIWNGDAPSAKGARHGCYGPGEEEDIEDAREVARTLGIPFHVLDLRQEYQAEVLDYFRHEYRSGRTPSPCPECNHKVKFDALLRKTRERGIEFDRFATGHYARVEYDKSRNRYLLKKARDVSKDQCYFLSLLSQEQLSHSLFPLGEHNKEKVREMASHFGLSVHDKAESQDFIAGGYFSLVEATPPGPIIDHGGNILGEHQGISSYTIGQRRGLGISAKEPLYVIGIDQENNAIIAGSKEELYQDELVASSVNWIAIDELRQPLEVKARIRCHHREAEAVVSPLSKDEVQVKFKQPQMAIAPGQTVVFYLEDVVVGGGTIERAREAKYG